MKKIKFNEPALFYDEILNIRKVFSKKNFTGNGFILKSYILSYKTI